MTAKTVLYEQHQQLGAKLVDFAGWMMPLHYGSQIDEHLAVRQSAGIFDVSHMAITDITGPDAVPFLRYLLANDIARIKNPGRAMYSCMLDETGGVIDDLIVYWLGENNYRLITNAGTRAKDFSWMQMQTDRFDVNLQQQNDFSIIALQGAKTPEWLPTILPPKLAAEYSGMKSFSLITDNNWVLATTGYTGEAGCELMVPNDQAVAFWQAAVAAGFKPVGLGARDTLRLEAGLNLYGSDMDETTTPAESNLSWTVSLHDEAREFIGKKAITAANKKTNKHMIGLILQAPGVLRGQQQLFQKGKNIGETTSGTYSPYLKKAIALARVEADSYDGITVEIRNKHLPVRVVKPSFVRLGKTVINDLNPVTEKENNT